MATVTGHYRIEPPASEFFTTPVLRLIVRDSIVLGRFGRVGFIRGRLHDRIMEGRWTHSDEYGWITVEFDRDYKSGECHYGVTDKEAIGHAHLQKIIRRSRRRGAA